MTSMQEAVALAAREQIGVRFLPQGRDSRFGLDCVGVVVAALAGVGRVVEVPGDYALRGGDPVRIAQRIDAVQGMRRVDPASAGAGDVLLMEVGAAQWHLGVLTPAGMVHADAGLRRVVETPGAPCWPVIWAWRVTEEG